MQDEFGAAGDLDIRRASLKAPGQSMSVSSMGIERSHMATRCGGRALAVIHCNQPQYEAPKVPMRPLHHGCAASHSTVS